MNSENEEKFIEKENRAHEANENIISEIDNHWQEEKISLDATNIFEKNSSDLVESIILTENDLNKYQKTRGTSYEKADKHMNLTNKFLNINQCPKNLQIENASKFLKNDKIKINDKIDSNFEFSQDENLKINKNQNNNLLKQSYLVNDLKNNISKNVSDEFFLIEKKKIFNSQMYESKWNQNDSRSRDHFKTYSREKIISKNDHLKDTFDNLMAEDNLNNSLDNIYIYDHNKLKNRKSTGRRNFTINTATKTNNKKLLKNPIVNEKNGKNHISDINKKETIEDNNNNNSSRNNNSNNYNKEEKPKISNNKCSIVFKFIFVPFLFLMLAILVFKNGKFQSNEFLDRTFNKIKAKISQINNFCLKDNLAKYKFLKEYIQEVSFLRTDSKYTLKSITNDLTINSFDFKEIAKNLANLKKSSKRDFKRHFNDIAFYLIKREYQLSDFSACFIRNLKCNGCIESIYNPSFILINLFENSEFNLQRKLNFLIASRNPIPLYYPIISIDNYNKIIKNKGKTQLNDNNFDEEIYESFEGDILQYKLNKDYYYFLDSNKKNFLAFSLSEIINDKNPLNLINDIFTNIEEQLIYNKAIFFYADYDTMNEKTKKNFNIAYCYGKDEIFNIHNNSIKIKSICLNLINKFDYIFITLNQKDLIKKEIIGKINHLLNTLYIRTLKLFFLLTRKLKMLSSTNIQRNQEKKRKVL